jgi:polypyrimidine tract-binding protein 2
MLFGVGNSSDAQPNRILLVTVHQVLYPMTVDVLQQVFSPHGYVEKIVTFQKSAGQILSDFFLCLFLFL